MGVPTRRERISVDGQPLARPMTRRSGGGRVVTSVVALVLAMLALATPAAARVVFGVGVGMPPGMHMYGGPVYGPPPWGHYRPHVYPGPPVYIAPPLYAAPPVYLAPPLYAVPPGYVAPQVEPYPPPGFIAPPGFSTPAGPGVAQAQYCDAGPYRCPMEQPSTPGAGCYCPGNNGQRVTGQVR